MISGESILGHPRDLVRLVKTRLSISHFYTLFLYREKGVEDLWVFILRNGRR